MKTLKFINEKLALLFVMLFSSVLAIAQETTKAVDAVTTSTTTTKTEEWYANPLYIAIGAILLIIIVALIARGNNKNS